MFSSISLLKCWKHACCFAIVHLLLSVEEPLADLSNLLARNKEGPGFGMVLRFKQSLSQRLSSLCWSDGKLNEDIPLLFCELK